MSAEQPSRAVIVFGRIPRPGRVKTRLTPVLSPVEAAELYAALLADVLDTVGRAELELAFRSVLALDLAEDETLTDAQVLIAAPWRSVKQAGADLGARMWTAIDALGASHSVVIGSDAPSLTVDHLRAAFVALDGHDVVLLPALDGGYALIGTRGAPAPIFAGIPWSTPQVLAATRRAIAGAGLSWVELSPPISDLDRVEDLPGVLASVPAGSRSARAIARALTQRGVRRE